MSFTSISFPKFSFLQKKFGSSNFSAKPEPNKNEILFGLNFNKIFFKDSGLQSLTIKTLLQYFFRFRLL